MSSPMKPLLPLAVGLALGAWLARRTRPQTQESPNRQAQLQQQIRQLKEGYEKQDRIRRDFTANVSHELKTPLTSISGYAEILREGMVKSEDVGRFAGKIYEEAQRLIALVEDILHLSHLDEGAPGQERRCGIDLYALCARALTPAGGRRPAAEDHPHPAAGTCQRVDGAEKLLEEILFNLCDNAIKYNKEGGRVEVSVTREPPVGGAHRARTPASASRREDQSRVFERFYRVDKSHSKEIGGTGLGLSIVKHAAAYHDAKIHIDSQLGRGTRVQVRFHPSGEGQP